MSLLHDDAYSIGLFNPLANAHYKIWKSCLHFKVVKFDHFEIGIVYHLPRPKKLDGVSCTYPVLDDVGCTTIALLAVSHIC